MLQRTRQAVSSTFADSNGSLEKGNSACIFHSCKNTRGLVCEPASWKKEMFRDGNTRGNKTNSTSHQEYLGTDMFYDICFYIRSTYVVHHYKCFLSNFQEKKKGLEFPIPETYMRMKSKVESEMCHLVTWISLYVKFDHFKDL